MKKSHKTPLVICVISLITLISGSDSFSQSWQQLDSIRKVYMERQSYDTALIYAKKTLKAVKEKSGENDTLYANMLSAIMEINYYSGNYVKTIEYCEKEREIRYYRMIFSFTTIISIASSNTGISEISASHTIS